MSVGGNGSSAHAVPSPPPPPQPLVPPQQPPLPQPLVPPQQPPPPQPLVPPQPPQPQPTPPQPPAALEVPTDATAPGSAAAAVLASPASASVRHPGPGVGMPSPSGSSPRAHPQVTRTLRLSHEGKGAPSPRGYSSEEAASPLQLGSSPRRLQQRTLSYARRTPPTGWPPGAGDATSSSPKCAARAAPLPPPLATTQEDMPVPPPLATPQEGPLDTAEAGTSETPAAAQASMRSPTELPTGIPFVSKANCGLPLPPHSRSRSQSPAAGGARATAPLGGLAADCEAAPISQVADTKASSGGAAHGASLRSGEASSEATRTRTVREGVSGETSPLGYSPGSGRRVGSPGGENVRRLMRQFSGEGDGHSGDGERSRTTNGSPLRLQKVELVGSATHMSPKPQLGAAWPPPPLENQGPM